MVRSELISRIAQQNPHLTFHECEAVVRAILGTMSEALARGDRVELRDFGSFSTQEQDARVGRNPRTGKVVTVAPKVRIHFKPGKGMQVRLNRTRAEVDPEADMERLLRAS